MISATSLPARIGYAVAGFPIGALAGYLLTLKLLIKFGSIFQNAHPSMQGFGYFMMSLAVAATFGMTASLMGLTLPWMRPLKAQGKIWRIGGSVVVTMLSFLILAGQGHPLIVVLTLTAWIAVSLYLTYIRHGVRGVRDVESL